MIEVRMEVRTLVELLFKQHHWVLGSCWIQKRESGTSDWYKGLKGHLGPQPNPGHMMDEKNTAKRDQMCLMQFLVDW